MQYGTIDSANAYEGLARMDLSSGGKRLLVVGSMSPWVEEMALALGAAHVATLEYNAIDVRHRKVSKKVSMWPPSKWLLFVCGKVQTMELSKLLSLLLLLLGRFSFSNFFQDGANFIKSNW